MPPETLICETARSVLMWISEPSIEKGPVKSEEEKMAIEKKAAEVAGGPEKIQSQLEVAGGK